MKKIILNNVMKSFENKYTKEQQEIIRYGFESIYIFITKTIIIFFIAYLIGLFKEVLIFSLIYNLIRMPSFGLHATKSWMCLISSTIIFIITPYLCNSCSMNIIYRISIGIFCILLIFKNAPADTYKRPIINKKRRRNYKIISTVVAISMVFLSIVIDNNFISNSFIFALIIQCFMISPLTYAIFKLPYNNYKNVEKMG